MCMGSGGIGEEWLQRAAGVGMMRDAEKLDERRLAWSARPPKREPWL